MEFNVLPGTLEILTVYRQNLRHWTLHNPFVFIANPSGTVENIVFLHASGGEGALKEDFLYGYCCFGSLDHFLVVPYKSDSMFTKDIG